MTRPKLRLIVGAVLTATALAVTAVSGTSYAQPAGGDATGDAGGNSDACMHIDWGICEATATDHGYRYWYWNGQLFPVPPERNGNAGGAGCGDDCPPDPYQVCELLALLGEPCPNWLANGQAIAVADLADVFADYLREELLPDPTVTVQPTGRSFANLPTLFYTAVPAAFAFDVNDPVPATISAVPRYNWDFGDGETGPDAPGLPYDPAISPREHPDAYVSHGYPAPGNYQVTLTVTWFGSFTVPGVAQAFPLEPVVLVAADNLLVEESAGVLTGND
jgi:hypothetical protein